MPRAASPEIRRALIERAAELLSRREPVTLRALATATGVSTMAVYTYFDGMPGLWAAVRQEGFDRLHGRLSALRPHRDPVRHLGILGVVYLEHALAEPALYRVMFDSTFDLPDPEGAAAPFETLIAAADTARSAGRFATDSDPLDMATRYWANGHGLASLTLGGVLPVADLERHVPATAIALCTAAGDQPERARRSVTAAWRGVQLTGA